MEKLNLCDISEVLSVELIDKIFKLKTHSQDDAVKIEILRAGPAGEGLLGAVYRIYASGYQHSTTLIAKGLVRDLLLRKTLQCAKFFAREILFYSKVLPKLVEIQTSLGAKERIQNYLPICFYNYCDGKNDYFVLEDLAERGFSSISHNHTDVEKAGILRAIAHFHATSIAMRLRNPEVFYQLVKQCPESYYTEDRRVWYCKYLKSALDVDKLVIAEYENIDSIYYKKFMSVFNSDVYKQLMEITSTLSEHPVLNHGDCWSPNFMKSKDQVVVFDFQLIRFCSPATDLSSFLLCNLTGNRRKDDFVKSVDLYHNYLGYFLHDMNLDVNKIFPRHVLDEELRKYGKYGFYTNLTSIPLIASEKCDVMNTFEEIYRGKDVIPLEDLWKLTPMKTREHKLRLVNALHVAVDLGLL
ncbi:uncharacterized protein LOC123704917 [Colias croceus]|uniref:uncharacterized protein LOC123704917 n=1 Tax=Colias crocea TaxID=72248 RepID=UPI001E28175B|nr:uncharacterized protein LOC123704917 [Colias croceus]